MNNEAVEEPEDVLWSSLGSLYGYAPITHADAGDAFTYTWHVDSNTSVDCEKDESLGGYTSDGSFSQQIKITVCTPDTHARNWSLHASNIWASSLILADNIKKLGLDTHLSNRGCSYELDEPLEVLELGAGAGLPGLLITKYLETLSPRRNERWRVTLSDYPDDLLINNLKENVRRNELDPVTCRVMGYAWGESINGLVRNPSNSPAGFDIIIASDTLWNAALHRVFLISLSKLLRQTETARVHLVASLHTGRYTISSFLDLLNMQVGISGNSDNKRLKIERVMEYDISISARGNTRSWMPDRGFEDDQERRRWIIWIELKWSNLWNNEN